ncbi:MAG: hypothetical protein FWF54_04520 [Candidatus Azobacteroides sp.]|nr:hypothetical protein [Candidatus Azobacteroides sp.]
MSIQKNTLLKAQHIGEITLQYYEPGRQDRSYRAVWRKYIFPVYPMCYRTYLNYLKINTKKALKDLEKSK